DPAFSPTLDGTLATAVALLSPVRPISTPIQVAGTDVKWHNYRPADKPPVDAVFAAFGEHASLDHPNTAAGGLDSDFLLSPALDTELSSEVASSRAMSR